MRRSTSPTPWALSLLTVVVPLYVGLLWAGTSSYPFTVVLTRTRNFHFTKHLYWGVGSRNVGRGLLGVTGKLIGVGTKNDGVGPLGPSLFQVTDWRTVPDRKDVSDYSPQVHVSLERGTGGGFPESERITRRLLGSNKLPGVLGDFWDPTDYSKRFILTSTGNSTGLTISTNKTLKWLLLVK